MIYSIRQVASAGDTRVRFLNLLSFLTRFQKWRARALGFFILVPTVLLTSRVFLYAGPVTFQFAGMIGPSRDGTFPIELPFSFAEGDHISGSFTFEPVDAAPGTFETVATQSFPFKLDVNSFQLITASYQILASDDLVSDDGPIPEDRIVLRCLGTGTPCVPIPIQEAGEIQWSFSWTLNGDSIVLDGADIPASVEAWNQFSPSSLLVSFQDTTTGRGTGFQATIQDFQIVPEPQTMMLLRSCCGIVLVSLAIRCPKR